MKSQSYTRMLRSGFRSLMLHRLRSLLTTLGVLFGTSSVIAMLAIGEGASFEAQEQIKLLGSQNVILRSVKPTEEQSSGSETSSVVRYGLTDDDFDRVRDTFPAVSHVVPVRSIDGEVRVRTRSLNPQILATQPSYLETTGRLIWEGRFLTAEDGRSLSNVCVLGTDVAHYLFPLSSPIGERIKIGPEYFIVVGTLAPRLRAADDQPELGEFTGEVLIPFETASRWFGRIQVKLRSGSREMEEVDLHEIIIGVKTADAVGLIASAAREMLGRNHNNRDYEIVVPLELLARAEETKRIFNIVLGSIAGISLLVGGIGIMNVMLATVTERTREIGIRRALGAKKHHIVTQFLIETVLLSVGGGLFGVALGLAIPMVVENFADMKTIVTPLAPIAAFGISAGVGIIFGIYPAWRAANMDPVEALRHE